MRKTFIYTLILYLALHIAPVYAFAKRIVSTAPHITEILFALDAGNSITGVTKYCNYPEEAKTKEIIGDVNINMEKIIKLKPDLIIADSSFSSDNISRLKKRGFSVLTVKCSDLTSFRACVKDIANAVGKEKKAETLLNDFDKKLSLLSFKAKFVGRKKRVFVEIWDSPLITAGKGTLIDELLDVSNAENIALNINGYARVGAEFVLKENPDVILLTTSRPDNLPSTWKNVSAVKTGQVFYIDNDLFARPSFRMIKACENIFDLLYQGCNK